jgi:hypothetical protein
MDHAQATEALKILNDLRDGLWWVCVLLVLGLLFKD